MAIYSNANNEGLRRTTNLPAWDAVTVCGWWYYHSAAGSAYRYVFALSDATTDADEEMGIGWFNDQSGNPSIVHTTGVNNWGTNTELSTSATYRATGAWYFWAATVDGTDMYGYLRKVGETAFQTANKTGAEINSYTPASININKSTWDSEWLNGRVAAVKIWDAVLTEQELMAESFSYDPVRFSNLNSWYPLFNTGDLNSHAIIPDALTELGTLGEADGPPIGLSPSGLWLPQSATLRPPPSDVKFGVVGSFPDLQTGGTVDITDSTFGGGTPKGFMHLLTYATSLNTATDNAQLSVGAAESTSTEINCWCGSSTGDSSTVDSYKAMTDKIGYLSDASMGSRDGWHDFSAFTTNGLTIDVSNTYTADFASLLLLIGGDDVNVSEGSFTLTGGIALNDTTDITTGFDMANSALIIFSSHASSSNGAQAPGGGTARMGMGFGSYDGTTFKQSSYMYSESNAQPQGAPVACINSGKVFQRANAGSGSLEGNLEWTASGSTSFTLTVKDATGLNSAHEYGYIAIGLPSDWHANVSIEDSPTSTGVNSHTPISGDGWVPAAMIQLMTLMEAVNVARVDDEAGGFGFRVVTGTGTNEEYTVSYNVEDNSDTTDTQCRMDSSGVLNDHDGTAGLATSIDTFTSDGYDDNFSAVHANAKKLITLLIGPDDAGGGGGSDDLTATDISSGTPSLTQSVISQTHTLTGDNLSSGVPVLDQSAITQTHVLASNNISSGIPTLDTPTLTEIHALVGDNLSSGIPTLTASVITQTHTFTGDNLSSGVPILDQPAITQTQVLVGDNLSSGIPTLDQPTLTEIHVLAGDNLSSGAPTLDQAVITQVHTFASDSIISGIPTLDQPTISQTHTLTSDDLSSGIPTLDQPILVQTDALTADDLLSGTPTLDQSTISQTHTLTSDDLVSGVPTLDQPTLVQTDALTADDISSGVPTLEQSVITQSHILTSDDISSGIPTIDQPVLVQTDALSGDDLTSGVPTLEQSSITQTHVLTADNIVSGTPTLDSATITQTHVLGTNDLSSGVPTIDSPEISQDILLTADNISSGTPTLDSPTLTQVHTLTADNISSGVPILDEATAIDTDVLTADNLSSGVPILDSPTITQEQTLTADDISSGTPTIDQSSITQTHALTGDDISSGVPTLDNANIDQVHTLSADDLLSGVPILDTAGITQTHVLTGDNLSSGIPTLDEATAIDTDALTADNIVTQSPLLDTPVITQTHVLTADNISSGVPILTLPVVGEGAALTADDISTSTPTLDQSTLGQDHVLTSDDLSSGLPTLDQPTLIQEHTLSGDNLSSGIPTLDSPILSTAAHNLTADSIESGAPTVDQATLDQVHTLSSDNIDAGVPILDQATLDQVHILSSDSIDTNVPTLDAPDLSQEHLLSGNDLITNLPILDSPSLLQNNTLAADNVLSGTPILDSPTLTSESGTFPADNIFAGLPLLSQPTITQTHTLLSDDLITGLPMLTQPTLPPINIVSTIIVPPLPDYLTSLPALFDDNMLSRHEQMISRTLKVCAVPCELTFGDCKWVECVNCSQGLYGPGGMPIDVCNVCQGTKQISVDEKIELCLAVEWNANKFHQFTGVDLTDIEAQIMTHIEYCSLIKSMKYIDLDICNQYCTNKRFKLIGEPQPCGFSRRKGFFIANLTST